MALKYRALTLPASHASVDQLIGQSGAPQATGGKTGARSAATDRPTMSKIFTLVGDAGSEAVLIHCIFTQLVLGMVIARTQSDEFDRGGAKTGAPF